MFKPSWVSAVVVAAAGSLSAGAAWAGPVYLSVERSLNARAVATFPSGDEVEEQSASDDTLAPWEAGVVASVVRFETPESESPAVVAVVLDHRSTFDETGFLIDNTWDAAYDGAPAGSFAVATADVTVVFRLDQPHWAGGFNLERERGHAGVAYAGHEFFLRNAAGEVVLSEADYSSVTYEVPQTLTEPVRLDAGVYTFTLRGVGGIGGGDLTSGPELIGRYQLELTPAAIPIPLPAAAVPALATMGLSLAGPALRRRRRTAF